MAQTPAAVKSFSRSAQFVGWWVLELDREKDDKVLVHNNWVAANGPLRPGDQVMVEHTHLHYTQTELPCALSLVRASKPALLAD